MAQIVVLSTKTQKKYTLDVQGNTLGDLKNVLRNNNIDFAGMTFFEGRTKTELLSDQSIFPENAVIRLTKSEKKITSGNDLTTRDDCKAYLKANPALCATIKAKENGKNWTNLGTSVLLNYCRKDAASKAKSTVEVKVEVATPSASATPVCECAESKEAWIQKGIELGYIDDEMAATIAGSIKVESISSEDMDMFKGF